MLHPNCEMAKFMNWQYFANFLNWSCLLVLFTVCDYVYNYNFPNHELAGSSSRKSFQHMLIFFTMINLIVYSVYYFFVCCNYFRISFKCGFRIISDIL